MDDEQELGQKIAETIERAFTAGRLYEQNRMLETLNNDPVIKAWFNTRDLNKIIRLIEND